jgi:hypothetical protein
LAAVHVVASFCPMVQPVADVTHATQFPPDMTKPSRHTTEQLALYMLFTTSCAVHLTHTVLAAALHGLVCMYPVPHCAQAWQVLSA